LILAGVAGPIRTGSLLPEHPRSTAFGEGGAVLRFLLGLVDVAAHEKSPCIPTVAACARDPPGAPMSLLAH
jgi:hypothetical protein